MQDEMKSKSESELEAWFLGALESENLPIDHMLAALAQVVASGKIEMADSWAELLHEPLKARKDGNGMLRLMKTICVWREREPGFRKICRDSLKAVFDDRRGAGFVTSSGIDQELPVAECLRRFEVLTELKPGRFCYDKTWGFGVVQRIDEFYQKIVIDFDRKKGHQMSFAYAGEALELLANDHIFAIRHNEPARLAELVANDPAEVVKMALRSYGPMSVIILKELLSPVVVKEEEWKNFWDGARKGMKDDPLVDFPSKRNDPIRLREKHRAYDGDWFAAFRAERDIDRILELLGELEGAVDDPAATGREWKEALVDRLAFIEKGCRGNRPDVVVRTVMVARRFGLGHAEEGGIDGAAITKSLFDPELFLKAMSRVPARDMGAFIEHMAECDAKQTADTMLILIPRMAMNVLGESMNFLLKAGRENDCAELFRSRLMNRTGGSNMLLWVCRNMAATSGWGLVNVSELLSQVLDDLKDTKSGDDLKAQNQLEQLLGQKDWLEGLLAKMNPEQRSDFVAKLNTSRALDDVTKRSLLAMVIRVYPELAKLLSKEKGHHHRVSRRGHLTSWRSYRERQDQFKVLIEKTIPENSREIGVALSYGDLRENHEYKTAKEMQGILLKRQAEMERDLKSIRGTDFSEMPVDKVGMGTSVSIQRPNGSIQEFVVLGEWDRDEKLGIISSESKLAKILEGARQGDEVVLPAAGDGSGEETCRIARIGGLSDEIKKWVLGRE